MASRDDAPVASSTAGPSSVVDALPQRLAQAVRRVGVRTNRDVEAITCASLSARRGIGRITVRALIDVLVAQRMRLACGCGWDGTGARFCSVARKHAIDL